MGIEIVKYNAMPVATMADIATEGQLLAQSGMFGAKNPAEGFVIAGICRQAGIPYLDFMQTFHFYHGRVSMKADAMLAKFQEAGGTFEIVERTAEKASAVFTYNGKSYPFSLSWEQAAQEPFVYAGGPDAQMAALDQPMEKRKLKDKYKTPVSRKQMLWARLVSDSVRCICPKVINGTYTPEEVDDFEPQGHAPAGPGPVALDPVEAAKRVEATPLPPAAHPAPAQFNAPAQAVQAVPVQIADPEPNPFNLVEQINNQDWSVCPIPGCAVTGKPWDQFDPEELQVALQTTHPDMMPHHYLAIREALAKKGIKA
jgi:hypothetical protein